MPNKPNFIVRLHQGGCDYAYLRRIFQAADALGYDGASLYDLLGIPTLECWTTLSALLPLVIGFVVCFLVAQVWRLAGA